MNTTAAALQANVTVATIRTWCRHGVITAVKLAGHWVIDAASLAARIAIGAMRARKAAPVTLNLNATYTVALPGDTEPRTITPVIKRRTVRRTGENIITVTGLAPLLADQIDAIDDEGARLHTLTVLQGARIVISDTADDEGPELTSGVHFLDHGRLRVQYVGTRALPVGVLIDLAHQLRAQIAEENR